MKKNATTLNVMTIMNHWDYGIKERGESQSKIWFYHNLSELCKSVTPIWVDEHQGLSHEEFQNLVLSEADKVAPDIIFVVLSKDRVAKETLASLKSKFKLIGWFGDDHWRYESYSKGYAPNFSYVVTTDPFAVDKYKDIGVKVLLSEWAGEPRKNYNKAIADPNGFQHEVTFVGGANPVRKWLISQLAKRGIHVECFGSGWKNGRVEYEEMDRIFHTSKINLNLTNSVPNDINFLFGNFRNALIWFLGSKRVEQVKARNFEIPIAGGFQLTNYVVGLERSWHIGKEIATYVNMDECAKQIEYFLKNENERINIAIQGHKRAIAQHTYINRLTDILEAV